MSRVRGLFILITVVLSTACSDDNPFRQVAGPDDEIPDADLVIRNFTAEGYTRTSTLWKLEARSAYMFHDEEKTRLFNIDLTYYEGSNRGTEVSGKRGILDNKTGNLRIEGDVKVVSANGRQVLAENMNWVDEKDLLMTDAPVKILFPEGDVITGQGLEADNNLNRLILHGGSGFHPAGSE